MAVLHALMTHFLWILSRLLLFYLFIFCSTDVGNAAILTQAQQLIVALVSCLTGQENIRKFFNL